MAVMDTMIDTTNQQDARWADVTENNARADGTFVYAVHTTGIFCKPSCSSRTPNRTNVVFYETVSDAAQAGYRPCKRCHPEGNDAAVVADACRLIADTDDGSPTLDTLAADVGVSASTLRRRFEAALGLTPKAYFDAVRRQRLQGALSDGAPVTDALYDAGFGAASRLYEKARANLGMTPASYGKGGKGAAIRFAVTPCLLGHVLVAVTDDGVCRITLGSDAPQLAADLRDRFYAATLTPDDAGLHDVVARLLPAVEGRAAAPDLPLDVRATAFQAKVWAHLQSIPLGSTETYADIARAIGHPKSARAVGNACGANPIAVVVPCHRAVPKNGENLGNYAWGPERKIMLLKNERDAS